MQHAFLDDLFGSFPIVVLPLVTGYKKNKIHKTSSPWRVPNRNNIYLRLGQYLFFSPILGLAQTQQTNLKADGTSDIRTNGHLVLKSEAPS